MLPTVVLIYSHKSKYQEILERQLHKAGFEVWPAVLDKFTWDGLIGAQEVVAKAYPDRQLLFLDAWDVVLVGDPQKLIGHQGVILAGERNCWPDKSYEPAYEAKRPSESPWRYLNTGLILGTGRDIAEAIKWGKEHHPLPPSTDSILDPSGTDMLFWANIYLKSPLDITIDDQCDLMYCMIGATRGDLSALNGEWINTTTWKKPVFVHANGGCTFPAIMLR